MMIRARAGALCALVTAASGSACIGGVPAHRSGPSTSPAPASLAEEVEAHAAELDSAPEPDRPGLGTAFGEEIASRVEEEPFTRASPEPFASVVLHYNDPEGVRAQADFHGAADAWPASTAGGDISIAVVDEGGALLPALAVPGRTYVIGQIGQRYRLRLENHAGRRYEVVASVDGLDVFDGRPASPAKRGYLLPPHGQLVIDGFRTSADTVAAFRFSAVRDSYAGRTSGDRNVGVVGFAFFAERGAPWSAGELSRRETADPFPGRYAAPPP